MSLGLNEPDPSLKIGVNLPSVPAPAPISIDGPPKMKRVSRPLRHVKFIPTKQLTFYSKYKEPQFTYDIKYKLPINKNSLVIQVNATALNPVDLQIINSYTSNMNGERGIGREYSGVITEVGEKLKTKWSVGDEVCGLYFHPNGRGTFSSSILVNPSSDPLIKKPANLSFEVAGSWMITFGTAFQLLKTTKVNERSSVLVNGGATGVGLMVIQLLKAYYKVPHVTATCSGFSRKLVRNVGADLTINYKTNRDLPLVLKKLVKAGVYDDFDENGEPLPVREIPAEKFDLIVDCVGSYDLYAKSADYLKTSSKGGQYVTIVGDKPFNHRKDIYGAWNTMSVGTRSWFGGMSGYSYAKFNFSPTAGEWMDIGADMLESGEIKNVIDGIYDWKQYHLAKERLQSGAHGKVVVQPEMF